MTATAARPGWGRCPPGHRDGCWKPAAGLYWLALDESGCTVTVSGTAGGPRTPLADLPVTDLQSAYTDGEFLYLLWVRGQLRDAADPLDPATGETADCAVRTGSAWPIGTWGDRVVVEDTQGGVAALAPDGTVTPLAVPDGAMALRADSGRLYAAVADGSGLTLTARPLDTPDAAPETLAELPGCDPVGAALGPVYGGQLELVCERSPAGQGLLGGHRGRHAGIARRDHEGRHLAPAGRDPHRQRPVAVGDHRPAG